jgi:hypothetical protein
MADQGYRGTRVRSPNSTGPQPQRPHPERDNAQDPRRPYVANDEARQREAKADGKGFVNAMMGGAGGMDTDAQRASPRTDDTRKFAKDEVARHLRDHRHGWQR